MDLYLAAEIRPGDKGVQVVVGAGGPGLGGDLDRRSIGGTGGYGGGGGRGGGRDRLLGGRILYQP